MLDRLSCFRYNSIPIYWTMSTQQRKERLQVSNVCLLCCCINSNLSWSPDTDECFEQLANCKLLRVFFRNFLLPNVWCFIRKEAVPEPHKSFRVRIRNAALNRSFKNTGSHQWHRKFKKTTLKRFGLSFNYRSIVLFVHEFRLYLKTEGENFIEISLFEQQN